MLKWLESLGARLAAEDGTCWRLDYEHACMAAVQLEKLLAIGFKFEGCGSQLNERGCFRRLNFTEFQTVKA